MSFYAPEFPRTRRSSQGLLLNTPVFNTVAAGHLYSSRIVKLWNDLPLAARSCCSDNKFIRSFKSELYKHYLAKLSTTFDVDNTCTWVTRCACPRCRPTWTRFLFLSSYCITILLLPSPVIWRLAILTISIMWGSVPCIDIQLSFVLPPPYIIDAFSMHIVCLYGKSK